MATRNVKVAGLTPAMANPKIPARSECKDLTDAEYAELVAETKREIAEVEYAKAHPDPRHDADQDPTHGPGVK